MSGIKLSSYMNMRGRERGRGWMIDEVGERRLGPLLKGVVGADCRHAHAHGGVHMYRLETKCYHHMTKPRHLTSKSEKTIK